MLKGSIRRNISSVENMKAMSKNRHPKGQNCIVTMANGTDTPAIMGTKGTVLVCVCAVSACACGCANPLQHSISGA